MKKTGSFKLLAVFLSVLLALEVFPFAVFANGQPDSSVSSYNTETPEEADSEAFYDAVGELEELRTETGKYLRMEDGSFTAVSYPFAVHFEEDGGFVEYDNTLVLRESGQGRFYTPKRSDAEIGLSPVSGSGVLYYLGKNGAKISVSAESLGGFGVNTVSAEPIEKRESKKETRFDEITQLEHFSAGITYRNIAPGTDAEYAVFGANVKETLTLRTAPEKGEWVYRLRTEGLRAEQTEQGEILFVNEQGETIYHIPVGCAYDANGALCALNYEPEEAGEDVLLRVSVPEEWLFSPERAYPVTVDPEFDVGGHDSNYINDTYAIEGSPNETIQYGNHFLLVGYATYYTSLRMRAFIRITNLPAIPASSVVVKATMDLQQMEPDEWYSFNGQSDYLHILAKPLTNWPSGLVSWNNMPTVDNTVLDYGTACYDTYSERFKLNVTSMAKEYYTGERNVFGVCLQSYTESQDGYVGFVSADNPNVYTSLAPYYTVHYRDTKGIDSRWEYAQQGLGDRASGYVNLFNGNLVFSVDVTDPVRPLIPVSAKITYNSFLKNKNFTSGSDVNAPVTSAIASYAGYGWKFSYHETVVQKEIDNRTYLCYSDADGTELYFYDYNDGITGNYLSEDGYPLTITSENGRYVMRDNEGNSKTFGSYGLLTETADSAGNKVVYDFTGAGWMDYALYYPNGGSGETLFGCLYETSPISEITNTAGDDIFFYYTSTGYLEELSGVGLSFQYASDGSLTKATDEYTNRYLVYTYDSVGRVSSVTEYGASNTQGQTLGFIYENQKTTVRSSGRDDIYGNADDILTVHVFDDYGRPVTVYSSSLDGSTVYGESSAAYTATNTYNNPRKNNALEKALSSGHRAVNLLANGSFEESTGWISSFSSGYSGGHGTAAHFIGQKSMTLSSSSATGTGKYTASVTVPQAGKYTLSAYVKLSSVTSATGGGALVSLNGTDGDAVRGTGNANVQGGWQRVYVTAELPAAGTYSAAVMLKNATGTAYFDCVQLEEGGALSSYNLLENAGFASGGTSWTAYSGPSAASLTGHGNVMKIDGSPENYSYFKQTIPVNLPATSTFSISGWASGRSVGQYDPCTYFTDYANESRDFRILLKVNYAEGGTNYQTVWFDPSVRGEWQFASGAFVASDANRTKTISTVEFSVYYAYNANTAYFDDFCLTLEPAQTYKYDSNGNLTAISPSDGNTETLVYTGFDLTTAESARGERYTYTYEQDGQGNSTHKVKTATSRAGVTATLTYNSYGVVTNTTITPTSGSKTITSDTEYSCGGSFISAVIDTFDKRTEYDYNIYTAQLKSVKDAKNTVTRYVYSGDLLTKVYVDADNDNVYDANETGVQYTYTGGKQLSKITTKSTVYNFAYDNFGNTVSVTVGTSLTPLASYTYGPYNGKPMTVTYADGTVVSTVYDALDRVKTVRYNGVEEYSVLYDGNGNLSAITEASTGYRYDLEYDAIGRLIRYNVTSSGDNVISSYTTYDSTGRESSVRYKVGDLFQTGEDYYYDASGRLSSFNPVGGGYLDYSYDAFERLSGRSGEFYGGTITSEDYQYTTVGNKTSTRVSQLDVWNEDHTRTFKYWYDPLGNISTLLDDYSAWYYSYDKKGQLTAAEYYDNSTNGGTTEYYTYDNAGNILSKELYSIDEEAYSDLLTTDTYTYSDSVWGDLLTAYNGQPITYDANGNPLSYRGMTLTWAKGRRLATLTKNNATTCYSYDRDGLRIQKTVGGVTHTYTYLGDRLVCEEWGSCYIYYIYDETGRPYGLIYCDGTNTDNYYFLRNLQGDVLELMASNGETVAYYEYDAWGKLLSVKDASGNAITSATHIANINPIRYRGYYYDTESGFYYLRSRYYDPEVCRFINPDSYLSTGQGVLGCNMFAYCSNDPVNYADHTGCIAANVVGALVGGIIGVVGGAFLGNWLADRIGLKGWERWVFVGGVSILIGATATAIGYLVGPYIAKAWTFFKGQLANLLKSSFKSVAKLSSNDLTHIMKSKHLWHKVLKNVTEKGVEELIKEAVKKGIWDLAENGVATITYKYAGQTIIVTGKIVEGVFRVGTSYVK